jgi:tetraacyldisaccharide 4'-kinase
MIDWRPLRLALWPFSVLYGLAARLRASLYRCGIFQRRRLNGTVISVGNLTVGGTGKTPMVLWLAERLIADGERPAILTRGYRGEVSRDEHDMPAADEVALLRLRLGGRAQLGVGKNRYENGRTLERHGAKWFILDDGFQHLALRRDVDIVLIDAGDPFGGGMLPSGHLREPFGALGRANVVVITRSERAPALESMVRRNTLAPIFYAQPELEAVLRVPALAVEWPLPDRSAARIFAFCGIGNPRAFFDDLRRWRFSVVGERTLRDHHRYSSADVASLERAAHAAGADAMICTEKDAFNLRGAQPGKLPVYACRIRLAISDPAAFWDAILFSERAASTARTLLAAGREQQPVKRP